LISLDLAAMQLLSFSIALPRLHRALADPTQVDHKIGRAVQHSLAGDAGLVDGFHLGVLFRLNGSRQHGKLNPFILFRQMATSQYAWAKSVTAKFRERTKQGLDFPL
jgi:hypothetical protein